MHKLCKLRVCLGGSDGVGILEHLLWVMVPSMGLYSLYELCHSLLPPVLQGRSPELLETWRHMEINLSNWELVFESRSVHPKAWTPFSPGRWRLTDCSLSVNDRGSATLTKCEAGQSLYYTILGKKLQNSNCFLLLADRPNPFWVPFWRNLWDSESE